VRDVVHVWVQRWSWYVLLISSCHIPAAKKEIDATRSPNRRRNRHCPNKLQCRNSSYSPSRGRSQTCNSADPHSAFNYPQSAALYAINSQSHYPVLSQDYRSRPKNDPFVFDTPNYQIQATGQGGHGGEGRRASIIQPQRHKNISSGSAASQAGWGTMSARPAHDPLVLNPDDYQIQLTGQGEAGAG
jgi:hypothetical protein